MRKYLIIIFTGVVVNIGLASHAQHHSHDMETSTESVEPGSSVIMNGENFELYGGNIQVGDNLLQLLEKTDIELPPERQVLIINVIPSIDTPVCGIQTYNLGLMTYQIPDFEVITISRDLPFAQERWAKGHGFQKEEFVSDYKSGSFGKSTGLMMKDVELLARAILVLDQAGIVQHIQIVPDISYLPDLNQAVSVAKKLSSDS